MPGSANPGARDHYVYVFHANGYPFYVGHGRSARLENRPIFVDSLVRLHPDRTYYKWALHGLVIAVSPLPARKMRGFPSPPQSTTSSCTPGSTVTN